MDIYITIKSLAPVCRINPGRMLTLKDVHDMISEDLSNAIGQALDIQPLIAWDNADFEIDIHTTSGGRPKKGGKRK